MVLPREEIMRTRRFERCLWVANIALVGVAAFFGAQGISAVVAIGLSPLPSPLAHWDAVSRPEPDNRSRSAEPILARNPFDSATGSLVKVAHAGEKAPEESSNPLGAPSCSKIHAVVIAAFDDADSSVAALEVEGGDTVLRRRGGEFGAAKVEFITEDRVFVLEGGKRCQSQLFAPKVTPVALERKEATPKVEPGALDPRLAAGITRDGPGRYRIERSVVDKLLEDQTEIVKGAVIRAEKVGDRTIGVRLAGVRPDRLFGVLGLQDNDVIQSLNGFDFSSPERMLEAFARLRIASQLNLDFTRGGQPQNYTYSIQ
jgi:general secretion pathway protein C